MHVCTYHLKALDEVVFGVVICHFTIFVTNKTKLIEFRMIFFSGNEIIVNLVMFHNNFKVKPTWMGTVLGWVILLEVGYSLANCTGGH
jgi:hypothetical protein